MGSLRLVSIALLLVGGSALAQTYGVGRTPTPEEIRALDISIAPNGEELPVGRLAPVSSGPGMSIGGFLLERSPSGIALRGWRARSVAH